MTLRELKKTASQCETIVDICGNHDFEITDQKVTTRNE